MESILLYALLLFFTSLLSHIMLWRLAPRRHDAASLAAIFVLMPLFICGLTFAGSSVGALRPVAWVNWGLASILHLSLSASYVLLYSAVVGFSPSIAVLKQVAESMPRGLARDQLAPSWFTDKNLTGNRQDNLSRSGLVVEVDHTLTLSTSGRILALTLVIFRRLLGLPDIANG